MSELKSFWPDAGAPDPDPGGAGVTARGGDPNIDTSGSSGLKSIWDNPVTSTPDGRETANSVSGLPGTPARSEPTDAPPMPPSLEDRNPGTIRG